MSYYSRTTTFRPVRHTRALLTTWLGAGVICAGLMTAPAVAADPTPTDDEITRAIDDKLLFDPGVKSYLIDARSSKGLVTLSGDVNNLLAKRRAAKAARTVRGVKAVVNSIDVTAPLRADDELKEAIETAFVENPATESWEILTFVDDGEVRLSGNVDSWHEKQLAETVAAGVRGVRSIDNQISITYEQERLDHEIRTEIEESLRWNALVDDSLISVTVNDGKVTLSGIVGSSAERQEASIDAWVSGVKDVKDDLQVERWARDDRFRDDKYVDKPDEKIEDALNLALFYDPRVLSTNVNVSIDNGVATLTGAVDSVTAKRSAESTARNTVGVWTVDNLLKVRTESVTDAAVAQRVRNALANATLVDRYELTVRVDHGVVTLTGLVDTYFEKMRADDVAADVAGVIHVNNNVYVDDAQDVLTYDPYIDDYFVHEYDWYSPPALSTYKTDWEIRQDVKDELWWSPYVDSDEINVSVDKGVAHLTGEVDTWQERLTATEQAMEGGAISVDNDLTVDFGPEDEQSENAS